MMPAPWRNRTWRNAGKGYPCTLCRVNPTTDAAHVRLAGSCGTGQKPADWLIVDACRPCHEKYRDMNNPNDAADILRALRLTLERRCELGFLGEGD